MDDNTAALLRALADKLGTTSEHLWGVLVAQAQITGYCNAALIVVLPFVIYWLVRWTRAVIRRLPNIQDDTVIPQAFAIAVSGVVTLALVLYSIQFMPITIAAFVNPEYVALREVLSTLRHR